MVQDTTPAAEIDIYTKRSERMAGTLYITATPIGNLGDISERALKTLSEVDFIAAEDTRVTLKLLSHFGISKSVVSYHEHNKFTVGKQITGRLKNGENCALVTDAGMPAVSDPGCELVAACRAQNIPVTVIPGASAVICAVALSGFTKKRFSFEGFLPASGKARADALLRAAVYDGIVIFYEAPHRLQKTLCDLFDALGDIPVVLVKEISKLYEAVIPGKLSEFITGYEEVRGEFVIVLENTPVVQTEDPVAFALELTGMGVSASDAAKYAAKKLGAKKNEIYTEILNNTNSK